MADIVFQGKLAEAAENHPCLYNFHLKEYSNRDKVQKTWESVAQKLDSTVKECKDTWRNMRIVFTRSIKQPSSGAKAKKKPWPLLQNMMFLKAYVTSKAMNQPSNLPPLSPVAHSSAAEDIQEESIDDVLPLEEEPAEKGEETNQGIEKGNTCRVGKPNPKIKKVNADAVLIEYIKSKKNVTSENPRKQFLMSLLPDVEEMTTPQFKKFRRDVLNLLSESTEPAWPMYQQPVHSQISPQSSWSEESAQSTLTVSQLGSQPQQENDHILTELAPFFKTKML